MIYYKNRYNNRSQLYPIISKRLYGLRGVMNIRRTFRVINAVNRVLGSRTSSQNCNLLIEKLNTKQGIVRIATTRSIQTLRARRSNSVLNLIQISMSARTASLEWPQALILAYFNNFWGTIPYYVTTW